MASLRILATGSIAAGGETQWRISPLVDDEDEQYQIEEHKRENPCSYPDYQTAHEVVEGITTGMIDTGEYTAEYEDYLIDVEWLRGGC